MDRRLFIRKIAIAPAAATLGAGWLSRAEAKPEAWTFAAAPKRKKKLTLKPEEVDIVEFLQGRGTGLYLYGGPVFAALCGGHSPWSNILLSGGDFSKIKRELFELGVQPISTLELQPTFIKFFWKDRLFNLVNAEPDEVCQANYVLRQTQSMPFAHNYLVYDLRKGELYDPFEVIPQRGKASKEIQLVQSPRTLSEAFDVVLAGLFDAELLGLVPGAKLVAHMDDVMGSPCPESQAKFVSERILNYYPDIVEKLGPDRAADISQSRLVNDALQSALGVDFSHTHDELLTRTRGSSFPGSVGQEFMSTVHRQLGGTAGHSMFESRVCHFLMQNNFGMRCPEWISGPMTA